MIVYNSMLVLIFLLMIIYHQQQPSATIRLSKPIPWGYAIISMGYIIFWAGLRSGFADTATYIENFENWSTGINTAIKAFNSPVKGPGWDFIQIFFKTYVSEDFHWWLATVAICSGIPIMLTLRKKSCDYLFSIFLFITSTTFSWLFNGIRQFLVAAILFGYYFLLTKRKRLTFICLVLACSLIHTSAMIMLPAVFFIDFKPFGKLMSIFIILILSTALLVSPLLDAMDEILQNSIYHNNLEQFEEDDGAHPLRVLLEAVPAILAFIKRKKIASLHNSFINLCINMSTVSAGLYFIAMLTSGIMIGRLPIYFSLYNLILIPYLINFVYTRKRQILYLGFYIVYLVVYFLLTDNFYYISDIIGNYA